LEKRRKAFWPKGIELKFCSKIDTSFKKSLQLGLGAQNKRNQRLWHIKVCDIWISKMLGSPQKFKFGEQAPTAELSTGDNLGKYLHATIYFRDPIVIENITTPRGGWLLDAQNAA
jgi:hypothetical protein